MKTRTCDACGRERPLFALDEISGSGADDEGRLRSVCTDQTDCVPPIPVAEE